MASRDLLSRLEAILPGAVIVAAPGHSDSEVWDQAQAAGAAVLTGNVADFLAIAADASGHHGLLLRYRSNDITRDMRAGDVADAIRAIDKTYPGGVNDLILSVNRFVRPE
jgi:Domain of unknown function (DUF5615)